MNILRIGFDIDGVLCSFLPECLEASKKYGLIPSDIQLINIKEDIREQFNWPQGIDREVFNADFYYKLQPNMIVINDIKRWLNDGQFIIFITARPFENQEIKDATFDWLKKYNICNKNNDCFFSMPDLKYIIAQKHKLDIFIDDSPEVIKNMIDKIKYPFLLENEINHSYIDNYRYNWGEIKNKINNMIYNF